MRAAEEHVAQATEAQRIATEARPSVGTNQLAKVEKELNQQGQGGEGAGNPFAPNQQGVGE